MKSWLRTVGLGPDGSFAHSVRLVEGNNTIEVKALDEVGNEVSIIRHVGRTEESAPSSGIFDAGPYITSAYFALVLLLGMVILYAVQRTTRVVETQTEGPGPSSRTAPPVSSTDSSASDTSAREPGRNEHLPTALASLTTRILSYMAHMAHGRLRACQTGRSITSVTIN